MASVIAGFEYDIFISYRHNDNLDGWVTDFVQNLEKELKATLKDQLTIYFDKNPHDGLLETHHVDKSLEGKLNCLIFIPIVSQTYCDPKSFAWQHEFCAFNKLASEDAPLSEPVPQSGREGPGVRSFGRDIKLNNGNVASRILSIKIHDLDGEDNALLENELRGPLRAIDFIYREAGVNRPLKVDDKEEKNLSGTKYRNQLNKVANSVKELIAGLKDFGDSKIAPVDSSGLGASQKTTSFRKKHSFTNAVFISILVALTILSAFIYSQLNKNTTPNANKSVAVLVFDNFTGDPELDGFCDGVTDEILNHLSGVASLSVTSRTSVKQFKGTNKLSIVEIGKALGVSYILEGSVRRSGSQIRITAQLIDAITDKHIWSHDYDYQELKDIFPVQTDVSTRVTEVLKLKLSTQEKESLSKTYTDNIQAYRLYRKGRNFWNLRTRKGYDSAEACYNRAIALDADYALAYSGLADCYTFNTKGLSQVEAIPISRTYATKALQLDSNLCEARTTIGFIQSHFDYNFEEGKKTLQKALLCNPNYPTAHLYLGNILIYDSDQAGLQEVKKALELDPLQPSINWALGRSYYCLGQFDLCITQLTNAINVKLDFPLGKTTLAMAYIHQHEFGAARKVIDQMPETFNANLEFRGTFLSLWYAAQGKAKEAEMVLKETREKHEILSPFRIAEIQLALGNIDKAFEYLNRAYAVRDINLLLIKGPPLESLSSDPRFKAMLKKMNLN